jgi:hypothetical protein
VPQSEPSLFDGLEARSREKPKRERSVARGACPFCSANSVALIRSPDARHLVWKLHDFVTFAGTRVPCTVTSQHLCDYPARDIPGLATPRCPHQ